MMRSVIPPLLILLLKLEAVSAACYVKHGPGGLTIIHKVPKECKKDFQFIVNVLDPIVQTHECTGVLIDRQTVVVPASCVKKEPRIQNYFPLVRVGSQNLNAHDGDEPEEMLTVCEKLTHRHYNGNPHNGSDIALLILDKQVKHHTPIPQLYTDGEAFIKDNCTTLVSIGWFSPRIGGPPAPILEIEDKLTIEPQERCAQVFGSMPLKTICAAADLSTNIAWDLGAPLLCNDRSLVGVASFTSHQAGFSPYVYTQIADYMTWINKKKRKSKLVLRETNQGDVCAHTDL